jgi:hypothetical protein
VFRIWPSTHARQASTPILSTAHTTHDGRCRIQPRRRPCSQLRARQAVAAVAVDYPTPLELPTTREAEAPRPHRLEANLHLHRAQPLDNQPEAMRLQLRGQSQRQTAPANNHREVDEAHSQACPRPKAAGSNDSTRYVLPDHMSTDEEHPSDFVPFSPIARNPPETRARRRNCQWNHRRPGQTESALTGPDTDRNVYGHVPGVRADAAWNTERCLDGREGAYTSNIWPAGIPSDGGLGHKPARNQHERCPGSGSEDGEKVQASSCRHRGTTPVRSSQTACPQPDMRLSVQRSCCKCAGIGTGSSFRLGSDKSHSQ